MASNRYKYKVVSTDRTIDRSNIDKFMDRVSVEENGCWKWTGGLTSGYGKFSINSTKTMLAHIWSYLYHKGEYDPKLDLDHLCHNGSGCSGGPSCEHRRCVNPNHLEPVTHKENSMRGQCGAYRKIKTHCDSGHEFTEENTIYYKTTGCRRCRTCHNLESRSRTLKLKAKNLEEYKRQNKIRNDRKRNKLKQHD